MAVKETFIPARRAAVPFPSEGAGVAPFQFPLDGNEYLRASMLSDVANAAVRVQGRLLRPSGEIANFAFTLRGQDALLMVEEEYQLGQGALLSVFAQPTTLSGSGSWGDTYITLNIVRGRGDNATELGVLIQSYVGFKQPAVWPGTPIRSSLDGPGKPIAVAYSNATGVGPYYFGGSTGYRLLLHTLKFQLNCDATPGTRRVFLHLFRGGVMIASIVGLATQAPGTANLYNCIAGGQNFDSTVAFRQTLALPPTYYLDDGDLVQLEWVAPGGALDQITGASLSAQRWLVLPGLGLL